MAFRWIVNGALVAIPIGATLGTLFGIDASRAANGEPPLFTPTPSAGSGSSGGNTGSGDSTGGGGGSSGSTTDNGTTNSQYCQLSYGISPPSKGTNYTLNPNQWGVKDGVSGLCLNVTTFDNETYASKTAAPAWSATWQYTPGPESEPVHAYPNIMVDDGLPVKVSNLSSIMFDVFWAYNIGNTSSTSTDVSTLGSVSLNTNVAIDMFLDADATLSSNSTGAKNEVMIWFAHFGDAAQVLGNSTGVLDTYVLNGTTFDLYYATNQQDQNVYSWVTSATTETFTGDLTELLTELSKTTTSSTAGDYPTLSLSDYLGSFSFGTEAFYADANVTFSVPTLSVDIVPA